jgi:hypothetical protein
LSEGRYTLIGVYDGTSETPGGSAKMLYVIPAAIALMSGYMAWLMVFRMRRDRVHAERRLTRGKIAFQPKDRARFLLNKSFKLPEERTPWEEALVSDLAAPTAVSHASTKTPR